MTARGDGAGWCLHCERLIELDESPPGPVWVDPEATGDDSIWREICDANESFVADHEPTTVKGQARENKHDGLGANANITVWFGKDKNPAVFQQVGKGRVVRADVGNIPFLDQLDRALKGQT